MNNQQQQQNNQQQAANNQPMNIKMEAQDNGYR